MRAVRERPRVAAVVGWGVLALLLVGALIGATAASLDGGGDRQALEGERRGALEARGEAGPTAREADELARALKAERRSVVRLRSDLRGARRDARVLKAERRRVMELRRNLRSVRQDARRRERDSRRNRR